MGGIQEEFNVGVVAAGERHGWRGGGRHGATARLIRRRVRDAIGDGVFHWREREAIVGSDRRQSIKTGVTGPRGTAPSMISRLGECLCTGFGGLEVLGVRI